MIEPRLFLCSGAQISPDDPVAKGRKQVELDSAGSNPNVHIRFENVARVFQRHLPSRLTDLLEIAAYVYAADCSTATVRSSSRCGNLIFGVRQRLAPSSRDAQFSLE